MSYSKSEPAFKLIEGILDEILHTSSNELTWEVENSRDFAYKIRQGIYAAGFLDRPIYADLKNKWVIKEKGNKVIAKRRLMYIVNPVGLHKKEFQESTVSGIIGTAINNPHLTTLYFPNSDLESNDLEMLNKWGSIKGWKFNPETKELTKCEIETKQSVSQSN